jgi:hypothetical protein
MKELGISTSKSLQACLFLCKNFSEMTAETVKIVLNVEKSKYAAFLDMLKLLEFVSVEPSAEEEGIAGYEADGAAVTDDELIASALEALEDKKHGRLVSLRDFKAQSGIE